MNPRNPSMKLIASAVVFTFTLTSLGITPETFAATGVSMRAGEVSPFAAGMLSVPAELGQVTETVMGDPKAPAFIHIQSAHGNYSAEKNTEELLRYIEKNSSVKTMFLEGAAGELHPEMFRIFPDNPGFNQKVTDKLMREGYLTGPEVFMITSGLVKAENKSLVPGNESRDEGMNAFGVEDLDAYKKDREAFIQVVKSDKAAEKSLAQLRASIDKRFGSKLNKDLLALVRQEEALGSGSVSFASWINTLGEGSKKHLKTDLSDAFYQDQYPSLIRYFRLHAIGSKIDQEKALSERGLFLKELEKRHISKDIIELFEKGLGTGPSGLEQMRNKNETLVPSYESHALNGYSPMRRAFDNAFEKLPKDFSMKQWPAWTLYAQFTILMQEMESKGLQEEIVRLKEKIQTALAKTPEEKEYLVQARQLYLLKRLFALELTRTEYEELRDSYLAPRDSKKQNESRVPSPELRSLFATALSFYSTAIVREQHMFTNALTKMREQKQQRAVIVTGGFHADGLKKLAASKHCSYLQITPRIQEVSKRDHEVYLRAMLGNREIETSQLAALLALVGKAQRFAVTGMAVTKGWVGDIRRIISDEINSESNNSRLKSAFSKSIFGTPAPALGPAVVRSEVRNDENVKVQSSFFSDKFRYLTINNKKNKFDEFQEKSERIFGNIGVWCGLASLALLIFYNYGKPAVPFQDPIETVILGIFTYFFVPTVIGLVATGLVGVLAHVIGIIVYREDYVEAREREKWRESYKARQIRELQELMGSVSENDLDGDQTRFGESVGQSSTYTNYSRSEMRLESFFLAFKETMSFNPLTSVLSVVILATAFGVLLFQSYYIWKLAKYGDAAAQAWAPFFKKRFQIYDPTAEQVLQFLLTKGPELVGGIVGVAFTDLKRFEDGTANMNAAFLWFVAVSGFSYLALRIGNHFLLRMQKKAHMRSNRDEFFRSEVRKLVRESYLVDIARADGSVAAVQVREGGNYTVEFAMHPVPTKKGAMEDYVRSTGLDPKRGIYIGNENQSAGSRDGAMAGVPGLTVLGVDENQQGIIPGVRGIGAGVASTGRELERIAGLSDKELPLFIGLDIDDTVLGLKRDGSGSASKEGLMADRRVTAEALAKLALRGVHLVFFTDSSSKVAFERIGGPLGELLRSQLGGKAGRIDFYSSLMTTKFHVDITPAGIKQLFDADYGRPYRMDQEVKQAVLRSIGSIRETAGKMVLEGALGHYYDSITRDSKGRRVPAESFEAIYPGFYKTTSSGNMSFPFIEERDPMDDGSVSVIALAPFPSIAWPGHRIPVEQEDSRRQFVKDVLAKAETAGTFQNVRRSEIRTGSSQGMRLNVVVKLPVGANGESIDIAIREGGEASIDITKADDKREPVTKKTVMEEFLKEFNLEEENGYFIGALTSSPEDRDGILTGIDGLPVLAVDYDQGQVMNHPQVKKIGAGPGATTVWLQELLLNHRKDPQTHRLPEFIGFSVDNVIVGRKPTTADLGGRTMDTETLATDREDTLIALGELIKRGVRIGFFADHEGELMKEKVLDPLVKYLNKEKIEPKLLGRRSHFTIPLYANGVITKYGLNFNGKVEEPSEKWSVEKDKNYHSSLRLGRKETEKILEILGGVTEVENAETDSWEMAPQGLLGEYYAERLTEKVGVKSLFREELKTTYPNFRYHLTAGKNVRPPVVEIRDEREDGTVAEITVLPLLAATMRPSSTNGDASGWRREDDERRRFFKILVERLGGNLSYHKQAVASPKESPERGDHQLVGQEIAEGVKLTQQMLDSVHHLMGVEDLILDQRLPEDRRGEATSRALAALKMMHQKLRNKNQTLESIQYQPDLFRDLFGVRPVIMAGGYATRFSSFIHKTAARAGLKKTNIGYTVQGSYRTPGVKPAVVVGEKILGLLVKDEYLAGYDRVKNAFVLDPKIAEFSPGSRKKEVDVRSLDPEKVRSYLGVDPEEVEIFQTTPEGGHGDHLVQVSSFLKTRNKKTAYFQVAFGEMSTAIDRSLTNPSLITYLEILGQDAQAVAGGKPSAGKIESKGNFFFNGDGQQLLLYTDWGIIPHRKKMKGAKHDKVWSEFGEKLAVLEKELETLRARHKTGSDELKTAVRNLRGEKDNEYFTISDDGYVLTQELLLDVNKDLKKWSTLDEDRKAFIKKHFAVMENGSSGPELLISSNTAIVQADLLYELKTDVDAQYLNGGYADYDPKNGVDDVHLTRMWTVDPKNGETQALAWNLFGMIADRNLKASGASSGSQYQTRFVNVGDTPASIKDSARQREFAEKIRNTEGEPRWVGYRPLTVAEGRAFSTISGFLIEGKDNKAKEQLEGLLKNKAYFSGFRHVVQALFARSQDQKWQADLLEVLESIRSQPPFFHDLISTDRPNGWVLSGVVESAIMEAVDAGVVGGNVEALTTDLHYATQIIQLRNRYAEKVRKNGKKREEYLLERLSFLLTESLRNEGGKIEDLLKFRDKFSPEHPTRADMPEATKEKPQVITITGGTSSGTLWVPVLESLGIRAHAGIKSVVGNTDDGGSTAKLIKTLNDAGFGITPPLGDLMNATSGAMTLDKKMHLMGDGGRISVEKGKNPTFEEMVVPFIHRTIADAGIEAQPLELQPDFFYFARVLLAAVRRVDDLNREIQMRNEALPEGDRAKLIEVNGQSIRNIYLLGFLVNKGLFEKADEKKKDKPAFETREAQKKYDLALKEAVDVAGAEQFSVTLSSLDPKTLYAEYQGHTLAIGIPSTDPKTGKSVTAYPNPAVITQGADGSVSVTRPMLKEGEPGRREVVPVDASQTIRIEEDIEIIAEFGSIALQIDGKLWKMDGSDPDHLTFTSDEGNVKVVMPDGTGRELDRATNKVKDGPLFETKNGKRIYWVSRFVKKQTNITELINLSKILKIGLLPGFGEFVGILKSGSMPVRLEPNHALLESIRLAKPQDVILIGPGSHFTSIMPHMMVQGMPEALQTARGNGARVILVMNGSFDNETAGYSPYELLETLEVTIKERSRNLRLTDMITDIAIAVPDHRIGREKIKEEIEKRVEGMLGNDEFNEVFKARSLNSVEEKQKLLWDEAALEEAVRLLSKDAKRKTSLGDLVALIKKDKHDPQSRLSKKLREIDEDPGVLIPSEVAWLILAALEEKESILKANAAASAMGVDHLAGEAAQSVFSDFLGEQSDLPVEQGAEALRELQFFVLLHAMYPQIKFSIRTDVGAASDAAKKSRGGISLMWEEKELIKSRWPELNEHIIKFPTRTVVAKRVAKREQGKFEDRVLFDPKLVAETLAPHINRSEMRVFSSAERSIVDRQGQILVNALAQRAKYDAKTGAWIPVTEKDLLRMELDMALVLGSADERVPKEAAELVKLLRQDGNEGMEVMTSGKYGPPEKVLLALNKLNEKGERITEAEYFADIMAGKGVPVKEEFIEKESISTVQNLWKSRAIMLKEMPSAKRILLMGMPWMQAKQGGVFVTEFTKQEGKTLAQAGIELVSYTPYIPDVASMSDKDAVAWLKVGLEEVSKVQNWPNQNGKDGKPMAAPVPLGSNVENAIKVLGALLDRMESKSQLKITQSPIRRSEVRGYGDMDLIRVAAKLARDHDDAKIADEFEAYAREIASGAKHVRDLNAWVGRGEWGLTSNKRWFFDRAKIELERNADGKATFYLGNAHIRGDEDDTWEAAFGLSGEGERIVSTLKEYGLDASLEDVSLPGDLHPAESYTTLEHELYLIVPLTQEEAVQNFLKAIRPLAKFQVRSYFSKVDEGVMKQEAARFFGTRSEVRLTPAQEKQFQKAMSDLQPKWWDGRFNNNGVDRRKTAVANLGRFNEPRVVSVLIEALQIKNNVIRLAVVKTLGMMKNVSALSALDDAFYKEDDDAVWLAMAEALWQLGDIKGLEYLLLALTADSNYLKIMSARILGEHKEVRAVPSLMEALKDSSRVVGDAAATALDMISDSRADSALKAYREMRAFEEVDRLERERLAAESSTDSSDDDENRGYWERIGGPGGSRSEVRQDKTTAKASSVVRGQSLVSALQSNISRSELRAEVPAVSGEAMADRSSLATKIGTAIRVAANTVSPLLSATKAYAAEIAPGIFAGTVHYQKVEKLPEAFQRKWNAFGSILAHASAAERLVIDQRQGIPDAASVLPLVTFALYNPKAAVVLALIADASEVAMFEKELAALSSKGVLPQNFKVQAFSHENEFVRAFSGFYNAAAPSGKPVALITDREHSTVTEKIGSRKQLLTVVGAADPLKQTASALLAADKLLDSHIWSMGYHFVSIEKLGGLETLMAELTNFVAAKARMAASA